LPAWVPEVIALELLEERRVAGLAAAAAAPPPPVAPEPPPEPEPAPIRMRGLLGW
jgi:hypothetical protein